MKEGESHLWQSVLHVGLLDATADRPLRKKRADVAWISDYTRDFRRVCEWAGKDPESVHERFMAGDICSDLLRMGGAGYTKHDMKRLREATVEAIAWLKENGPATTFQIRKALSGNGIRTRAAVMLALSEGSLRMAGHRDYVTVYEAA